MHRDLRERLVELQHGLVKLLDVADDTRQQDGLRASVTCHRTTRLLLLVGVLHRHWDDLSDRRGAGDADRASAWRIAQTLGLETLPLSSWSDTRCETDSRQRGKAYEADSRAGGAALVLASRRIASSLSDCRLSLRPCVALPIAMRRTLSRKIRSSPTSRAMRHRPTLTYHPRDHLQLRRRVVQLRSVSRLDSRPSISVARPR